ncbi:MAG: hypothetical protein M0Q49_09495, partial [Porticoccaceae bacterium]|nr:hypothetical protein [Porticoccaceae bacterium]
ALYALFFRQDNTDRSAMLYEIQLRQGQEVEAQLQQQLEERMKQLDEEVWVREGLADEEEPVFKSPPWRH